jgi:hypothetical protein
MTEHQTSRTLVKSAPELWAECSDAASLARHLGSFGEIRITKLEPETAVAWEGTAASGTVRLEPSGWGTRVTMTMTEQQTLTEQLTVTEEPAEREAPVAVGDPDATAEQDGRIAEAVEEPELESAVKELVARPGMFARLMLMLRRRPPTEPPAVAEDESGARESAEVVAVAEDEPGEPASAGVARSAPGEEALAAALDSLGRAHHRPYSRA